MVASKNPGKPAGIMVRSFSSILKFYRQKNNRLLWAGVLVYLLLSIVGFIALKYFQHSLTPGLGTLIYLWQAIFYPVLAVLMQNQILISANGLLSTDFLMHYSTIPWGLYSLAVIANLIFWSILVGIFNLLGQRLFRFRSEYINLLQRVSFLINLLSIAYLILGGLRSPVYPLQISALSQHSLWIGLLFSIGLILEIRNCYETELKPTILLFLLIIPLFPLMLLLLFGYFILDLPYIKKFAEKSLRALRIWIEMLYVPRHALIQIQSEYPFLLAVFITLLGGGLAVLVLYFFPEKSYVLPNTKYFFWGFLALFQKLEIGALYIVNNFKFESLLHFQLPVSGYVWLWLLFILSFPLLSALIDFTAWTLFGLNKRFPATLLNLMLIFSAAIFLFLSGTALFWYVKKFIEIALNFSVEAGFIYQILAILLTSAIAIWLIIQLVRMLMSTYNLSVQGGILLLLSSLTFFPISLLVLVFNALIELISYIWTPIRKGTLQADIRRLEKVDAASTKNEVTDNIKIFFGHLQNRYTYNIFARRSLNAQNAFSNAIRFHPKVVITHLLLLAEGKDLELRQDAIRWLASIFTFEAPSHIQLLYFMLEQKASAPLLGEIAGHLEKSTHWYQLIYRYQELLRLTSITEYEKGILFEISARYRKLTDDFLAMEFSKIYEILGKMAQMRSIREIPQIDKPVNEYFQFPSVLETKIQEIFRQFLRISQHQSLYERLEEENKMPYLTMQLVLLVQIQRDLDALRDRNLEKTILTFLTTKIQNWAMTQINQLRGEIELIVELKTENIPSSEEESVIVVQVYNAGTALAQNVRLTLDVQASDFYAVIGESTQTTKLIEPKANQLFEFIIHPLKATTQRMAFKGTYMDIDSNSFEFEYGDQIHFTGLNLFDEKDYKIGELVNPYIAGKAVAEPRMFFGRLEEFNKIKSNLEGQYQDNILVLHGQRRAGKSSMLLQMQNHLSEDRYFCIYIDLESIISNGLSNWLFRLATIINRELTKKGIKLERPKLESFAPEPATYFMESFLPQIYQKLGSRKLLIMFDEFELIEHRVSEGKLDRDIFPLLRSLMQHSGNLSFILAGMHRLSELRDEYWSLLLNITKYIKIGYLDKESSEKLICEPVQDYISYDKLAIEKIFRVTAGQPFFIQLICHDLFNSFKRKRKSYLTIQDVNSSIEQVIRDGAGHLDHIWDSTTWNEKIVLATLADLTVSEGEKVSLGAIGTRLKELFFDYQERDLREALKRLIDIEILTSDPHFDNFGFRIDIIRQWLKEIHSIGKTIEEFQISPSKTMAKGK